MSHSGVARGGCEQRIVELVPALKIERRSPQLCTTVPDNPRFIFQGKRAFDDW
jgi:hypothetical protein